MNLGLTLVSNNYGRWLLWGIIAIVFSLGMPLSPISLQCPTIDSAIFLTCAKWMQDGLVMYRDMFDHKGPMIYLFDMLGLNFGLTGVWLLCIFWAVLTTHIVYLICRIYADDKCSFLASICFLLMTVITGGDNTVELVAMPFVAFAMLVLLRPIHDKQEVSCISVFIASLCLAVTFLLKPNIGAGIAFLALVVLFNLLRNFSVTRFCLYLLSFLCGFAIILIPLYLWLEHHNAWDDYLATFWQFNMEYSSNIKGASKLTSFLQLFFLYIPSLVSWGFILWCIISEWKTQKRIEDFWLLAMLIFTGIVSTGMSGFRFGHYLLPVFVIFAIFIAKAVGCIKKKYNFILYGLLALWCCYFGYKQYQTYKGAVNPAVKSNVEVAKYVKANTVKDNMICLYGVDASVYLLSDRKSVTKYIYQNPIFGIRPSMYDEFISDICHKKPSLLLVGKNESLPGSVMKSYTFKETIGNGVSVFVLK